MFSLLHGEAVRNYVESSKWPSLLSVKCVNSTSCSTEGDALRELDSMNIIRSDPFVLINGLVISNLNLRDVIAYHKEKRLNDPNNVMTVVLKPVQSFSAVVPIFEDLVVSMNKRTSQILLFDNNLTSADLRIPLDLLEQQEEMSFRTDLLDCHVDVCSPEFLLQFSDNFDYQVIYNDFALDVGCHSFYLVVVLLHLQNLRRDFIQNEVSNWSLGKHIYAFVLEVCCFEFYV